MSSHLLALTSLLLHASHVTACTTEIATPAAFYSMKASMDLILDVRTLSEYTGDGNVACNAAKANKCNHGHDPDMWMLVNGNRADKAAVYKVNGSYVFEPAVVQSLKSCYGSRASTMKIAISCRSGGRSAVMQDALVAAGFACGNMYNVNPGAQGLWNANASKLVKGNTQKGPWSCSAAPPPANGTSTVSSTASSTGTSSGQQTSSGTSRPASFAGWLTFSVLAVIMLV